MSERDFSGFEELLLAALEQHPQGLSEYELLQFLGKSPAGESPIDAFGNNYALFREHFLLFHSLYKIRDRFWQDRKAVLEISAMQIKLLPYRKNPDGLMEQDVLRDYYLDLSNLETTTEEDVEQLLASFWLRLLKSDQREQALTDLGLRDPVDDETIKRRYRRLAMRHHPDRGGNKKQLQLINSAMEVLARQPRI
jgi:DnaJ-domain-containing protein 1